MFEVITKGGQSFKLSGKHVETCWSRLLNALNSLSKKTTFKQEGCECCSIEDVTVKSPLKALWNQKIENRNILLCPGAEEIVINCVPLTIQCKIRVIFLDFKKV